MNQSLWKEKSNVCIPYVKFVCFVTGFQSAYKVAGYNFMETNVDLLAFVVKVPGFIRSHKPTCCFANSVSSQEWQVLQTCYHYRILNRLERSVTWPGQLPPPHFQENGKNCN